MAANNVPVTPGVGADILTFTSTQGGSTTVNAEGVVPVDAGGVPTTSAPGTSTASAVNVQGVSGGTALPVTAAQATAANLNATVVGAGAAGSPSGGVVSVQGVGGGTAVPVSIGGTVAVTAAQATAANLNATVQLQDGSGNAVPSTAASTAATATQRALVVGLSPNSPLPTGTNSLGIIQQGAAAATANAWATVISDRTNLAGLSAASTPVGATQPALAVGLSPNSPLPAGTNALGSVAVTANALPTGAATSLNQTNGSQETQIIGGGNLVGTAAASSALGAAVAALAVAVSPNTPLPAGTNTLGAVARVDALKATYTATVTGFAPAASATDVIAIGGSASKTVRVTRLELFMTQTTSGAVVLQLIKRSAADTGGTVGSTPTPTPHDSTNPAVTGTLVSYTANPSQGAVAGVVKNVSVLVPSAATVGNTPIVWTWGGPQPEQAIVLRGTAQQLCLSLGGVTVTGGNIYCSVTWTEE